MLLLLFGDCSCDGLGNDVADGIVDHDNAPFTLQEAKVLFAANSANDENGSDAFLFMGEGATCEDLLDAIESNEGWPGQGLLFGLDQYIGDPEASNLVGFQGLWMGYAYADGSERALSALFFSDGMQHILSQSYGSTSTTWLDIESANNSQVTGSFATSFWSGRYTAERCDSYTYGGGDTGWDTGW